MERTELFIYIVILIVVVLLILRYWKTGNKE